ncbi:nucleotidyltransferase family protein [Thiocystis violascens]|uniref:Nucleoside-diphosphate-sugar pyrophosphorylase family protein n=1 Tax=Thiocystis violascens (strain ATCC 17096 / DSM 198 / 6111) TaxID=765911 RepID=I3YFV3_THIV6|nr:nucleotidyltransferase family protein [Thiocystis violascens]AFL75871.1 Nucleoside-diphosphate-sugar pyrophosphorylase family protein [Thiocystis violascens DSM 198]
MQAIILAGGLGTRLRGVIADLPKPMAPINGRPFLAYVLDALDVAGFDSAILAIGYRSEAIHDHFGEEYRRLRLHYSVEHEPLGTGGAIRLALEQATEPTVFVVNGDTFLQVDYRAMLKAHLDASASLSLAVHALPDVARYGALERQDGRVRGFLEKGRVGPGAINAGTYLVSRELFERYALPRVCSFETDLLMPHVAEIAPLAFETGGLFIDIGVPEDYVRAQDMLEPFNLVQNDGNRPA